MTITLKKGNTLSLKKQDGSALTKVRLGLGWDAVKRGGFFGGLFGGGGQEIDLDASAVLLDGSGNVEDIVFYNHLYSKDGSVRHTGDNLTGDGDGDDEQIVVDLNTVPSNIKNIVFVITSYSGQKFDEVENVFARVVDLSGGAEKEFVRYDLADSHHSTANVIAKLTRTGNGWEFAAIGDFTNGKTPHETVNTVTRHV